MKKCPDSEQFDKRKRTKSFWDKVLRDLDANKFQTRKGKASKKQARLEGKIILSPNIEEFGEISRDEGKRLAGDFPDSDSGCSNWGAGDQILADFYQGVEPIE